MIDQLKNEYINWLNKEIKLEKFDHFIEITTPFVDMHHDSISLFLVTQTNDYKLTDDGYLINELEALDIDIKNNARRRKYLKQTLKIFGISYNKDNNELYVEFDNIKKFPDIQHRLTQCVIRVSDMMMTSFNRVLGFFTEDIANYFLDNDVGYNENVGFVGKTGQNQIFDFVLPRKRNVKPKLIQAINDPKTNAYKSPLVSFFDVQNSKADHDFIVLTNDVTNKVSEKFTEALTNHGINVLPWSKRNVWIDILKSS